MSRKNIYEILNDRGCSSTDYFARIRYRFDEQMYEDDFSRCTLKELSQKYIFKKLPRTIRKDCINLDDLMRTLSIQLDGPNKTMNDVCSLVELVYCLFDHIPNDMSYIFGDVKTPNNLFQNLLETINVFLEETQHKIVETKQGKIVVRKNAMIDQAAYLVSDDEATAIDILEYNHYKNKGNLEEKKKILASLGQYVAPVLQSCSKKCSANSDIQYKTAETVRCLLNNFHIRHNNKKGEEEKQPIIEMSDEKMEEWYDKTYNSILSLIIFEEQGKINDQRQEFAKKKLKKQPKKKGKK